jgi:hypothetical protein
LVNRLAEENTQFKAQARQGSASSSIGARSRDSEGNVRPSVPKAFDLKILPFEGNSKDVEGFFADSEDHFNSCSRPLTDHEKNIQVGFALRHHPRDWYQVYQRLPQAERPSFLSRYEAFRKEFKVTWGDPDCQATAEREFTNLCQVTSVTSYAKDFHCPVAVLKYPKVEAQLLLSAKFYDSLKDKIKDHISHEGREHDLDAIITQATRWDTWLQARRVEKRAAAPRFNPKSAFGSGSTYGSTYGSTLTSPSYSIGS